EVFAWFTLEHRNIVRFLGLDYKTVPDGLPCLVLSWASNGNITDCMNDFETKRKNVPLRQWDIIEGLKYIHSEQIAHGDLRPPNVLIDKHGTAQLSDLGVAKFTDYSEYTEYTGRGELNARYASPELIRENAGPGLRGAVPTMKSDVYSFGCMWLEIHTRRRPFPDIADDAIINKVKQGEQPTWPITGIQSNNVFKTLGELDSLEVWQTVKKCLSENQEQRPRSDELDRVSTSKTYWIRQLYFP
ncbi:kinase-like protein, partial [Panus rudis PR-1116 ss-1]